MRKNKAEKELRWNEAFELKLVAQGRSHQQVIFEQSPEGGGAVSHQISEGRVFQAEEKATAKGLRWKCHEGEMGDDMVKELGKRQFF